MFDVETVDRIEALPASGATHAALDSVDLATAPAEVALALLAAYERCIASAQARQFAALARLDQLREVTTDDFTREEVAAVLRVATGTAAHKLDISRTTMDRLPATAKLLSAGELDHTIPWAKGGPTALSNLHCLCKRHHRLKDENTGWTLRAHPDGSVTWTSPAGREYTQHPHDYGDTRHGALLITFVRRVRRPGTREGHPHRAWTR